jgi:hypothetical protein
MTESLTQCRVSNLFFVTDLNCPIGFYRRLDSNALMKSLNYELLSSYSPKEPLKFVSNTLKKV